MARTEGVDFESPDNLAHDSSHAAGTETKPTPEPSGGNAADARNAPAKAHRCAEGEAEKEIKEIIISDDDLISADQCLRNHCSEYDDGTYPGFHGRLILKIIEKALPAFHIVLKAAGSLQPVVRRHHHFWPSHRASTTTPFDMPTTNSHGPPVVK